MEAKQTPLIELLEAVPADARLVVEDGPYSTSFHPVGRLCHDAAAALRERMAQPEQDAVLAEREACAELVWPTQQIKTWSEDELTAMTGAFNRAQEKHGWYETIMAVGAAALKDRAAAIRARGQG